MNKIHPPNRLIKEKSPYLLQHAHNPVDWYPWGDEAFDRAGKEDKPVLLSVGYSTCHWCHVMEHESFENESIAAMMNSCFVSIKVDREERPDIDQIFMTAAMAINGQGGWPLTVFLTPEKIPFYAGTYFPPFTRWGSPGFMEILKSIDHSWKTDRARILASSHEMMTIIKQRFSSRPVEQKFNAAFLDKAFDQLQAHYDSVYGGFGQAPKFPMGHTISFLLRYGYHYKNSNALDMAVKTLSAMAEGGIYDHLGGGFHRYATDQTWHIPHFEKMLYDQALLVRAYCEGYQLSQNKEFARIVEQTLDYVLREMQASHGGFFCAYDADSSEENGDIAAESRALNKEGAYYVWSYQEIQALIEQKHLALISFYYGIEPAGNAQADPHGEFLGKNILYAAHSVEETAVKFNITIADAGKIIHECSALLLQARSQRSSPHLDDKILTEWNGLMIGALAFAYQVFGQERYLHAAIHAADFILENLVDQNGRLLKRYRDGQANIQATLEDYAYFVSGLMDLYEATNIKIYFDHARRLLDQALEFFWDSQSGGFFMTASDAELVIVRPKDVYDGALPSGNSVAALVLSRMYYRTGESHYYQKAQDLFKTFSGTVLAHPSSHPFFLSALDFYLGPVLKIELSGPAQDKEFLLMVAMINQTFIPDKVQIVNVNGSSRATAVVCRGNTCYAPVHTADELKALILAGNSSKKADL